MGKVRDRLWLAGVMAGKENPRIMKHPDAYRKFGSFISPVEAATYLHIPNIIMLNRRGMPVPGSAHAAQCVFAVSAMKKVFWTIGSKEYTGQSEAKYLNKISEEQAIFCGAYIDGLKDRFCNISKKLANEQIRVMIQKEREVLLQASKKLELLVALDVCDLYEVEPDVLEHADGITLRAQGKEEMLQLEEHLSYFERVFHNKMKMLRIPFFDVIHDEPVSEEILEYQCKLGLRGMQDGWLKGMVFEGNGMMGVGFPADRWVRDWIAEVGNTELPE